MIIIGLGHKARRGKDTVAEYLANEHGLGILHFSDALYEECRMAQVRYRTILSEGIETSSLTIGTLATDDPPSVYMSNDISKMPNGDIKNLFDKVVPWIQTKGEPLSMDKYSEEWIFRGMLEKDGRLLQWWGTEFRRRLHDDLYWINKVDDKIEEIKHEVPGVAIPDTRFRNEAAYVRNMDGGALWKVQRDKPLEDTGRDPNHISEIDLDNWSEWDTTINNNGGLDELYKKSETHYKVLVA